MSSVVLFNNANRRDYVRSLLHVSERMQKVIQNVISQMDNSDHEGKKKISMVVTENVNIV